MLDIQISYTTNPKEKPSGDASTLGFGRNFTDHMFLMDYDKESGWHSARIVSFADFTLSPASAVFHYGQEVFEGMKAYSPKSAMSAKDADLDIGAGLQEAKSTADTAYLFRPESNARRHNNSCARLCIPQIPEDEYVQAVKTLVDVDRSWIPKAPGTSLYIRPFVFATEPYLGVAPSGSYTFAIIMSPSGLYYSHGLEPVSIWVEDSHVRAVRGGVGMAKTGGNYAASLIAHEKALKAGCDQVLWLDANNHHYIEEVGSMNVFFIIDGVVVTPKLSGSILPGITRDSIISLCHEMGLEVVQREVSIDEIISSADTGALQEVFGTGTAAVITPVGNLHYKGEVFQIAHGKTGVISQRLYDTLTGIQTGALEDPFGWRVEV